MKIHPISQSIREIVSICKPLGFNIALGPEIETEFYNFDALNVPKDHPARDMQDTFWLKQNNEERKLLRTHTSSVQVRYLQNNQPPFRILAPGKVFRNESTDATHDSQFYQLEGLVVEERASLSTLKWLIEHILTSFFKEKIDVRFRPSFFPFVEPGVEIDMYFKGKWMEIMGAGMVHEKVFESAGKPYQSGFAFGVGVDRLVMIKYGIPDIRLLYSGDIRVFDQFTA